MAADPRADTSGEAVGGSEGAICDGTAIVRAHDAADIAIAATVDTANNFEIFHGARAAKRRNKADILGSVRNAADIEAVNGVPLAIKGAVKRRFPCNHSEATGATAQKDADRDP